MVMIKKMIKVAKRITVNAIINENLFCFLISSSIWIRDNQCVNLLQGQPTELKKHTKKGGIRTICGIYFPKSGWNNRTNRRCLICVCWYSVSYSELLVWIILNKKNRDKMILWKNYYRRSDVPIQFILSLGTKYWLECIRHGYLIGRKKLWLTVGINSK